MERINDPPEAFVPFLWRGGETFRSGTVDDEDEEEDCEVEGLALATFATFFTTFGFAALTII